MPAGFSSTTVSPRRRARSKARARPGVPSAPRRARRPPLRKGQPLRIRWDRVGRVVLLVVLAVVLGLYVQQGVSYLSARSQANEQAAVVQRLARENRQLVRQETSLNNPATIVKDARKLGMVKAGERPFVVTGLPGG